MLRNILLLTGVCLALCGTARAQEAMLPPRTVHAPEFPKGLQWLNTDRPLSLKSLRGKFVLLDFWTYGCINCLHIIPDLKKLEEQYADVLVVIGVHSGKFDNERDTANIRQAILRHGIKHPVVNDPDFIVWQQYAARAWPSLYLIDPEGYLIAHWSGEGFYPHLNRLLQELIPRYEAAGKLDRSPFSPVLDRDDEHFLAFPGKVALDPEGQRLFISDTNHNRIVVAHTGGQVLAIIGQGSVGFTDGLFEEAQFHHPQGLWYDIPGQRLFVADTENHALRVVDFRTGQVRTLAGTGHQAPWGFREAGPGRPLNSPWDVLLHEDTLYVAMAGSHQIWAFDPETGHGSVYAGDGGEDLVDGPRLQARLAQPSGLATDGTFLYIADSEASAIRRVPFGGPEVRMETLIGEGLFEFGDVDGTRPHARLQHPLGVACAEDVCYIADTYNHKIRVLDLNERRVTSWLGDGKPGFRDGRGKKARFAEPGGLAVAGHLLYIADTNNHAIRVADRHSGKVHTLRLFESLGTPPSTEARGRLVVAPGEVRVRVEPHLPTGFKLNPLNPGYLTVTTPETSHPLELRGQAFEGRVVMQREGNLHLQGKILYCTSASTICKVYPVDVTWTLVLSPAGPRELHLAFDIKQ